MHTNRVHFYSSTDMSISMQYERMEEAVKEYEKGKQPENINDYLEMFKILQFVEHQVYPCYWSDERLEGIKQYRTKIAKFFSQLRPQTIAEQYESVDFDYQKTIWKIVDTFKIKKLINKELLQFIVDNKSYYLRYLLEHKWIVETNSPLIAIFLKMNPHTAEWLLDQYVADYPLGKEHDLFFPAALTAKDKDEIIRNYVNSPGANLNYIRLVLAVKRNNAGLSLLPLTIKAARNREKILNQEIFEHGYVQCFGVGVGMSSDKNAPVKEYKENENGESIFIYNRNVIDDIQDVAIPYYCAIVFEMFTYDGFIRHISKLSETSVIERIVGIHAKNTYFDSMAFRCADNLSILQMQALNSVLHDKGRSLEGVIKQFYEVCLNEEFGYEGQQLTLPSDEKEIVVRIRSLVIEMDAVAHQYDCFVENGSVDNDLIELTPPKKLTETRSLVARRYCVLNRDNAEVRTLIRLFFSDQTMLAYVQPCEDMNLKNLYALMMTGIPVKYESYANYQKPDIDYLINRGYLAKDREGILICEKMLEVGILEHLYEYGACGYWGCSPQERVILDYMEMKGWIFFDNHLFTPAEVDYFSYYLNNEKFTNGPAIRNNYAHGTTPSYSKEKHEVNYYRLQVLFVMLLLKIAEDLNIKRLLEKNGIE